jgi:dihydroorotase-like cyclic amidohydrolase
VDYENLYICPGIIDMNVCFNTDTPSNGDEETIIYETSEMSESSACLTSTIEEEWEGYEFGTRAAIAGGVTTVIESPTLRMPPLTNARALSAKIASLNESILYCDVGVLAYLSPSNLFEVKALKEAGALGFKAYLVPPCSGFDYFNHENFWMALSDVADTKLPIILHPEKTTERHVYMSSPFRNISLLERQVNPNPSSHFNWAGAFPEDLNPTSGEASPQSSTNSTPMRVSSIDVGFASSPSVSMMNEDRALEIRIRQHSKNLDWLTKVEIATYEQSGITVFEHMNSSPYRTISEIPEIALSKFEISPFRIKLERTPETHFSQLSINSPIKAVHMPMAREFKRPTPIQCEKILPKPDMMEYSKYLANFPPHWELNAVLLAIQELNRIGKGHVHISNLSSVNAVYAIRKAKKQNPNLKLTCETSGVYLHFHEGDVKNGDTRFKIAPPIRNDENRQLLINILNKNTIDTVTSYHRPVKPSLKFLDKGDFQRAVSGASSVGLTLQCLRQAIAGDIQTAVPAMFRLLSENPARIVGINSKKGSIAEGKLADFVVWDPFEVEECERLRYRHPGISPFSHKKLQGKVYATYLRGRKVFEDNKHLNPYGKVIDCI